VLFFIAILIGGRSSILGPLLGTLILTVLPEFAAPLAAWSHFLYAVLLLVIVLAMPGGIASLLDAENRRPLPTHRHISPNTQTLAKLLQTSPDASHAATLTLTNLHLSFGGVKAINGVDLTLHTGQVHGLIGPNGSGKTTLLNIISGYYPPQTGHMQESGTRLPAGDALGRARRGVARTFQTPRFVGDVSVLHNVMVGGDCHIQST